MSVNRDSLTRAERRLLALVTHLEGAEVFRPVQGRDNSVAIVDGRWVIRIARTEDARSYFAREQAVLQQLSQVCRVPRPLAQSGTGAVFEYIPGSEINASVWRDFSDIDRSNIARQLRVILQGLHTLEPSTLPSPEDVLDAEWVRTSIDRCATMPPRRPLACDPHQLLSRFELAWSHAQAPTAIVHVDLKPPHLLVDEHQVAIIDFGGVSLGDPALDYGVLAHYLGDDLLTHMGIGESALAARARCYADLYHLRMCTRGWTRTAPRFADPA